MSSRTQLHADVESGILDKRLRQRTNGYRPFQPHPSGCSTRGRRPMTSIAITATDPTPYEQIRRQMAYLIESEALLAGEELPTVRPASRGSACCARNRFTSFQRASSAEIYRNATRYRHSGARLYFMRADGIGLCHQPFGRHPSSHPDAIKEVHSLQTPRHTP